MDIKEIALRVAEEMPSEFLWYEGCGYEAGILPEEIVEFAEALIESYKAELLKEAGEPVAEFKRHPFGDYTELSFSAGYSARRGDKLYTSDQVAAAVLKATGPLEDSLAVVKKDRADLYMETLTLRDQLAKAEQLWQVAQGRCDGLEEKLATAEQRVSEACARMITNTGWVFKEPGNTNKTHCYLTPEAREFQAEAIRSGEWRKFVKEV